MLLTDKGLSEFYQKLHDLEISIIPRNKNGYISKKIQYFNNSVLDMHQMN